MSKKKSDRLSTFALCALTSGGLFSPVWLYLLKIKFYDLFKTEIDMTSFTMFSVHLFPFLIGASISLFFLYLSAKAAVKEVEIEHENRRIETENRKIADAVRDAEYKKELAEIDIRYHARMKEIDEDFKQKMAKIRTSR